MDDGTARNQSVAPWILVAETEPISRTSLSELLREEGYSVVEVADSGTAISELSRDSRIKVVLADLEMPSWRTIVKHAHSQMPEAFILGMLRYGALANGLEAQLLGSHAYLIKPLEFAEVKQRIQLYLAGQSLMKT